MHFHLKYKRYFDKKARATPLKINHLWYNPKADNQSMKFAFKGCTWISPHIVVHKVLSNSNYVVRRTSNRYTQTFHRVLLRLYAPNQRVPDITIRSESFLPAQEKQQPIMIGTRKLGKLISEKFCSENLQKSSQKKPQLQKLKITTKKQRTMRQLNNRYYKLRRG